MVESVISIVIQEHKLLPSLAFLTMSPFVLLANIKSCCLLFQSFTLLPRAQICFSILVLRWNKN